MFRSQFMIVVLLFVFEAAVRAPARRGFTTTSVVPGPQVATWQCCRRFSLVLYYIGKLGQREGPPRAAPLAYNVTRARQRGCFCPR